MKQTILIYFISIISYAVSAQNLERRTKISEKEVGFNFTLPKGFSVLDSGKRFACGDGKLASSMVYTLVNRDSSVRIGIAITAQMNKVNEKWIRSHGNPSFDAGQNFIKVALSHADTAKGGLVLYPADMAKKLFNADVAGEYSRNCNIPYEQKYPVHKVVFAAKNGRGNIDLIYFFTQATAASMRKTINRTVGMLMFN